MAVSLAPIVRTLRQRILRDLRDEAERRYHLSIPISQAGLDQTHRRLRERLEAAIDQHVRLSGALSPSARAACREQFLTQAIKDAGATFLNRLVLIRQLEAFKLVRPSLVTGGFGSPAYQELREFAPGLLSSDTEGYFELLQVLFDELALDLPGLFGDVGLTGLFPIPASTLRAVVSSLDRRELQECWTDDTTLGWVYQYWNDPDREAVDAQLDAQHKLSRGDIASKTQVFTERYMVEWLLQNSLGHLWLCICSKHGWTSALPSSWPYYLPRSVSDQDLARAPDSIASVRLLDPACGSGHFLVIAFDLLVRMYKEEARLRQAEISDAQIAESILANNLHGIDIDPRAVRIAAAALLLKAKTLAPQVRIRTLNLVAPTLRLDSLAPDDPALVQLRTELSQQAGLPEHLTDRLVQMLAGVDHLGVLLKVHDALAEASGALALQTDLFRPTVASPSGPSNLSSRLEQFLAQHAPAQDLGLRLDGEQLAAGVQFLRLAREHHYDLVVGNPPYFGTQSLADSSYLDLRYPDSKENLCTAMLDRAMQLVRPGGMVAFVTVRNWLYVSQLTAFRQRVFQSFPPVCAADLDLGGFESLSGVEVMMVVAQQGADRDCVVVRATDPGPQAKAALLASGGERFVTRPSLLAQLPGSPFVYRWPHSFIESYLRYPLLGHVAPVRVGMKTSDNLRFLRRPWELAPACVRQAVESPQSASWVPYIKGAQGKAWIEPLSDLVFWRDQGLAIRIALESAYGQPPQAERHYFEPGVAFSTIGRTFVARAHRYPSIFDVAGSSVFPANVPETVCLLNSKFAREVVQALNPTINFQVGDVGRIPVRPDPRAAEIFQVLEQAFAEHETTDERSFRFRCPGPSPWSHAQEWAQQAVDRAEGEPLPPYQIETDPPAPEAWISYAVGIALGRFEPDRAGPTAKTPWRQGFFGVGAESGRLCNEFVPDRAGPTAKTPCRQESFGVGSEFGPLCNEPVPERPPRLPSGILFLSIDGRDSLDEPACRPLHEAWQTHGTNLARDLRTYLRTSFFAYHKALYENRPIYLPLSSSNKSFVALVSVHRWTCDTLNVLLADHLIPHARRLEGELDDIRKARAQSSGRGRAERRFSELTRLLHELQRFIEMVVQVAERGPLACHGCPPREADARFEMHLDDGVMVNSAALWPLLEPQWRDPSRWWAQLACRSGPKGTHFDWSQTARRYFPTRVLEQCRRDPVLAVAHQSLWTCHPEVAYAWELRMHAAGHAHFQITEPGSHDCRTRFLEDHPRAAEKARLEVAKRRPRRRARRTPAE